MCYICSEPIDLSIHHEINIDHIIPPVRGGKDSEENFAITHESCNKSKQDSDLEIARTLHILKTIREDVAKNKEGSASLKHILQRYDGSKFDFSYKLGADTIKYSFPEIGDNAVYNSEIFCDGLSKEKTVFIEAPLEYIYFDKLINPRGINQSISKLIKEFKKGNAQLHLSLARIEDNKLQIFDGQHKAAAQILLKQEKLLLRVFIDPNIERLIETNTNAGSGLRQIGFDKSVMHQLNDTLYKEKIQKYQKDHQLPENDFSFSEQQLVDYFKGDNKSIKKYIIDSIKNSITHMEGNKLKGYIDFEGKSKTLPISYSAFDKTILSQFVDSKYILKTPIDDKTDEGTNPREIEISQIVDVLNILAEEIYIGKFMPDIGISRIEQKIIEKKDTKIAGDHIAAYRISKEEIMFNWIQYLIKGVIINFFSNTGQLCEPHKLFQKKFDPQLMINIKNFVKSLVRLPLWKDKSMASTIFSGKRNYDYWKKIFDTGNSLDGVHVLARPLDFIEMIKDDT